MLYSAQVTTPNWSDVHHSLELQNILTDRVCVMCKNCELQQHGTASCVTWMARPHGDRWWSVHGSVIMAGEDCCSCAAENLVRVGKLKSQWCSVFKSAFSKVPASDPAK